MWKCNGCAQMRDRLTALFGALFSEKLDGAHLFELYTFPGLICPAGVLDALGNPIPGAPSWPKARGFFVDLAPQQPYPHPCAYAFACDDSTEKSGFATRWIESLTLPRNQALALLLDGQEEQVAQVKTRRQEPDSARPSDINFEPVANEFWVIHDAWSQEFGETDWQFEAHDDGGCTISLGDRQGHGKPPAAQAIWVALEMLCLSLQEQLKHSRGIDPLKTIIETARNKAIESRRAL